ncbi:Gfo/Idh/MocA family oxidoreductase [Salinisphaera sp. Q1T1-3]|uniref:Gfo/Idh/MocA family oxidoreductase n=1 Tax=Salinisphaera sp. Q1T1-3 TaxID=2321229 RepID=UPI000E732B1F|nr:Gfo/Idh/MocA family oxidoreductase [Salinisphaera sp. Q1T1-3]RJS93288.1 oxidoreductase [Salinisphaera sp. Q1T1-3]
MTDASSHRIALIGYGLAGAVFHAPLISATPGLSLAAVVTGNEERAAAARTRYPGVEIMPDPETLWQHSDSFDAVVVASPNGTHAALAEQAIAAGLATVVDKPLAATPDQAKSLIAAARAGRVPLTVFQNRRWDNDFLTLEKLLADDRLGPVRRFESRFERWRPEAKPGWKRDPDPLAAGGILFDLGSHLIDQALTLFGPAQTVYAELDPRYVDDGVDDDSFIALRHDNGVRSHLWMSSVAPVLGPRFRVLGARAGYEKYGLDPQEDALKDGARPDASGWGRQAPGVPDGHLAAGSSSEPVATRPGDYPAFYRRFAAALAGDGKLPVAAEDGLATLRVIEAARRSAGAGGELVHPVRD